MDESLEARVARLEAINEIRGIMADYTHYSDTGWEGAGRDAQKMAALFAEDAATGAAVGREAIANMCSTYWHTAKMSLHIAMNPKIEVDGETAQGSWTGLVPLVTPVGEALWVGGRYELQFVRRDGRWQISSMKFFTAFQTPYDEGFAKTRYYRSPAYEKL
jgi:hypothetical protein